MKIKLALFILIIAVLCIKYAPSLFNDFRGDPEFAGFDTFQDTLPDWQSLDGTYTMIKSDVFTQAKVDISSSTPDSLHFVIESLSYRGSAADYSGTAYRTASSSLVYVANQNTEGYPGLCIVTIHFIDSTHLTYNAQNSPDESMKQCSDNVGVGAHFPDDEIHEKDFKVVLPTIKVLGFTDTDIAQFEALVPGVLPYVQIWLTGGAKDESAIKLHSTDIKNALAFSITSPNVRATTESCDFALERRGHCTYAAFMKDASGHYWIMGGTIADMLGPEPEGFAYGTNDPKWKNKLPDVFKAEMERLGLTEFHVKNIK